MARRTKREIDELTKTKIKISQLVNRLEKHALNKTEIMTASQIRAAEILLNKSLPNLSSQDMNHKGAGENGEIISKLVIEHVTPK